MSFLRQLEQHYRKQGYEIYSKHLKGLNPRPSDWQGVLPDLVAVKAEGRIAVFVETSRTLADPLTPERWRTSEQMNKAALHLFVHRGSEMAPLGKLLREEGIRGKVGLVQKQTFRRRVSSFPPSKWVRLTLGLLVIVALCYLLVWLASVLYQYQVEFYEPRDMEREYRAP